MSGLQVVGGSTALAVLLLVLVVYYARRAGRARDALLEVERLRRQAEALTAELPDDQALRDGPY